MSFEETFPLVREFVFVDEKIKLGRGTDGLGAKNLANWSLALIDANI